MTYNIPENLKGLTEAEVELSRKNTDTTLWEKFRKKHG